MAEYAALASLGSVSKATDPLSRVMTTLYSRDEYDGSAFSPVA